MSNNNRKVQKDRVNTKEGTDKSIPFGQQRVKKIIDPSIKKGQRRVRRPAGNKGKSKS